MSKITIYPVDGNLIIGILFLSIATFEWKERGQNFSIDRVFLTFAKEEFARNFANDNNDDSFGCRDTESESNKAIVYPDFNSPENASKAVYHAIGAYKDSLVSIDKFVRYSFDEQEEEKIFIKSIEDYIENYFGEGAIRVELSNDSF